MDGQQQPPVFVEEGDVEKHLPKKTGIACDRVRQLAKQCVKQSDCVQIRRGARECVEARDGSVPQQCYLLMQTLTDCKRSMIDMRARFRGRKGDMDMDNDDPV